jgi:hypothetical protein
MSKMTETPVPKSGGDSSSRESSGAGGRREERVKITRTIAPGDHAPSLKILHRKTERVKLDGTIVIGCEATYGNQILNNAGTN